MVIPRDDPPPAPPIEPQNPQIEPQVPLQAPQNFQQPLIPPPNIQIEDLLINQPLRPSTSRMANPSNNQITPYITDKLDVNIQRLKGSQNWSSWKWQVLNALDVRGLRNTLEGDDQLGSPTEVATRQILSCSLDQSLICKVNHCNSAQDIWKCLRSLFENNTTFALTDMISQMNSFKMETLNDVENGISKIQLLASQIKSMGGHIDQFSIESAILRALPETFEPFISSWSFFDTEKRTVENLQSYLLQAISRMRSRESNSTGKDKALAAANELSKGKAPQSSKQKSNGSSSTGKDSSKKFCRYCKKTGHTKEECFKLKNKLAGNNNKKNNNSNPNNPGDDPKPSSSNDTPAKSEDNARIAFGHIARAKALMNCLSVNSQAGFSDHIDSIWIADSGASFHMTSHLEWLVDYVEFTNKISVTLGNNDVVLAHGRGFIETSQGVLDPVYYLPKIGMNLFSISACARNHRIFALTTDKEMIFLQEGKELFKGHITSCGIYEIRFNLAIAAYASLLSASLMDWHDRLAHTSLDNIKHMAKNNLVDGMFISNSREESKCVSCAKNKITRSPHQTKTTPRATKAGQILHLDTIGKFPISSLGGASYYVLCKDSYSGYRRTFFVSTKDLIANKVKQLILETKRETGNDVLQIITDNGTEFNKLNEFLNEHGISHTTSASYTPEQNGLIERDIRTVAETAGCFRTRANLPKEFWAEAVSTAAYTLNRSINSVNREKTPYELWFGKKPSLKNLRKFGERAIVYTESHRRDKLDEKGEELIFVGYTGTFNTLRFIHPETYHLVLSCNYRFLNKSENPIQPAKSHQQNTDEVHFEISYDPNSMEYSVPNRNSAHSSNHTTDDNSVSLSNPIEESEFDEESLDNRTFDVTHDNEHIYEEVNPGEQVRSSGRSRPGYPDLRSPNRRSLHPDLAFDSPAQAPTEVDADANRLATLRPRNKKPNYMGYKLNLSTLDADSDPQSYQEAINRPDSDKWYAAMQEELDSLRNNNVWIMVKRPKDKNIVTNRWVFRIKRSPDGKIERYRARLVARGFSQVEGIDYFETYSPTASMPIVRLLFAYAAIEGLCIRQFDICTAFLYGELEEEVYMQQPQGFEQDNNKVCLLKRSLYGLKQAPRQWCRKFSDFLLEMQLHISSEDRCVFYRHNPFTIVIIYVDDGIVFTRNEEDADNVIVQLSNRFNMHSMELSTFLGFQIKRPTKHQIILHQESYVNKILTKFGGKGLKTDRSPISPTGCSDDDSPLDPKLPYREIVGSLLYAAITTRLDIAFPVGLASRMVSAPKNKHWFLVQRIMRYLAGEKSIGISYSASSHKGLVAYCDSDYANDETGRSTTGMIIMFGGSPIHWRSVRQTMVTLSPSEAETVSLCSTVKEIIWLRNIATELGLIGDAPITIFCDNTAAIRLGTSERAVHRTKHLRAQFQFCREQVELKVVDLKHIPTNLQLADMHTKPLPVKVFLGARNQMMTSLFAKSLFVALSASAISNASSFKFDTVGPILYQETDKYVDTGIAEYSIDYTYLSSCDILKSYLPPRPPQVSENTVKLPPDNEVYILNFIRECDKLYQSTWIIKLNEMLNKQLPTHNMIQDELNNHNIKKRGLGLDVVMGTVVSNFVMTLFEPLVPWSDYHRIHELSELVNHERNRVDKYMHQFNSSLHIQKGILEMIKNNTISLREQKRQYTQFILMSSQVSWIATYLQTRIMMSTADLRTIIDHMSLGQLATAEAADLFNRTELRSVDPRDTELKSIIRITPNTLRFKFNIRLMAKDSFIYQVHSFRYWDNLTHTPSLMEYRGREYVLWNRTSNCVKGIEKPIDRAVLDECSEVHYADPNLNIWQSISSNNVYKDNAPSYKTAGRNTYVYCFPWNITIGLETTRCPMLIFKLDSTTPFRTKNISFSGYHRRITSSFADKPFIEGVSQAHFDSNRIAENNLVMFDRIQILQENNKQLLRDQEVSVIITKHGFAYWLTIIIVGILILTCGALILYVIGMTKHVQKQNRDVSVELKELKDTYQSTSCINCATSKQQQQQQTIVNQSTPTTNGALTTPVTASSNPVTINFGTNVSSRPLPTIPENMS